MATTRLYLDLRSKAKDGKGSVIVQLRHNYSSATFPTGIRLFPYEWNSKRQQVINCPSAELYNAKLQNEKGRIDRAVALLSMEESSFDIMTASELKKKIPSEQAKLSRGHLLVDLFTEYLEDGDLKEGTKEIYRITQNKVVAFSGSKFRIEDVSLKWLRAFDKYLSQTQSVNGKSIYLRALRAVCNYALHNDIEFSYPFRNFQIKSEPTRKRSVSIEEFRALRIHPVEPYIERYRDYFFLMFYLIGINVKDLLLAKKSQIVDGRLEYIREKTGKKYSIKIEPEAQILLDKYQGKGEYLLEAMDHCVHYKSFAREINEALQKIGNRVVTEIPSMNLFAEPAVSVEVEPLVPNITTYFSRHCWATFAYEKGISMDIISQALGHSFGNKTTLIYVKPNPSKVDEANRIVLDYLLED